MARNRKSEAASIRFGTALKTLLLCGLVTGAGLGYVWLQEQIQVLSKRLATKELEWEELRSQNVRLLGHLRELQSPRTLDARVRELAPGLGIPQPDQVVRVVEANPGPLVLMAGPRLGAGGGGGGLGR